MGSSSWFIRDLRKRFSARDVEVQRRALLYVARNTTLSAQIRHKAQLSLNALNGGEGRMTSIRNRCVETGKGQGILSNFGLCRFRFRENALAGRIPGMKKASW